MSKKVTRRQALLGASAALLLPVAVPSLACRSVRLQTKKHNSIFLHGIASGDPDQSSVVIWTRVSDPAPSVAVHWQVATDPDFADLQAQGDFKTDAKRDYTVKIVVEKLAPGRQYFYRFAAKGSTSAVGSTRTLPTGHVEKLVLAVASCSNYAFGHFNGYAEIASDPTIDFVVHLGDYIYEHGHEGYGGEFGKRIGRNHHPRHEILTLDDYRARHAQYKTDPSSLAMHARHPLIVIWDDHETANNPWMGGAKNHQVEEEGSWLDRRAAAMQAYFEWLPIRDPVDASAPEKYWRHYKFGDLASLITLESRHTGRSLQIDYDFEKITTFEEAQEFLQKVIGAPERTVLSSEMESFLQSALAESVQSGRRWRVIGNQSIMAKTLSPKLDEPLFEQLDSEMNEDSLEMLAQLRKMGEFELPGDLDAWDGYPAAREHFYQIANDVSAQDLLVLTGDSHINWTNQLYDDSGQPMGLELGTPGISSRPSLSELGSEGLRRFDELMISSNREVNWVNAHHRGYMRVQLDHHGVHADHVSLSTVEEAEYTARILHSVDIVRDGSTLRYT